MTCTGARRELLEQSGTGASGASGGIWGIWATGPYSARRKWGKMHYWGKTGIGAYRATEARRVQLRQDGYYWGKSHYWGKMVKTGLLGQDGATGARRNWGI
jgi:hypothetical protein